MRIEVCQERASKSRIKSFYSTQLNFPDYLHQNWDSFEECLNYVQLDPTEQLEIVHVGWTADDYKKVAPYREIIETWAAENDRVSVRF